MAWQRIDNKRKILQIFNFVLTGQIEIRVRIEGEETSFTSKFSRFNPVIAPSAYHRGSHLLIEPLFPETGNTLIRSFPRVHMEFIVSRTIYRCIMKYIGTRSVYSRIGLILTCPKYIEVREKPWAGRLSYTPPKRLKVEFKPRKKSGGNKKYKLNVHILSEFSLGLIITQKDADLRRILHEGDILEEMTFVSSSAMIKTSGIVQNISKIENGEYKDCNLLRIELPDVRENRVA
ncbi:hypothetical protein ACFL7E_04150 [Thermodesulfobacteriota bacterium]